MKYYYNEETKSFAIATNFDFKELPHGYVEISKEEFENLRNKKEE